MQRIKENKKSLLEKVLCGDFAVCMYHRSKVKPTMTIKIGACRYCAEAGTFLQGIYSKYSYLPNIQACQVTSSKENLFRGFENSTRI